MNVVMIVPTGLGCEIGGHAGDACAAARLLASTCDKLITHPNVVNASDINEMTENTLYVEGSMLDRFLEGQIGLQEVEQNKILLAVNKPLRNETVNSVSAARVTLGADISIVVLGTELKIVATREDFQASGEVFGYMELCEQVSKYEFDALAVSSDVQVKESVVKSYLEHGGINPWGGAEAVASKYIANELNKPVAHAPMTLEGSNCTFENYDGVTDPRLAAEIVSISYLHCILKGLHKAPRPVSYGDFNALQSTDIDCLVSPYACWGRPHKACAEKNIPIIFVRENKPNVPVVIFTKNNVVVGNYLEAAGYIMCMKAGVLPASVRRPIEATKVIY